MQTHEIITLTKGIVVCGTVDDPRDVHFGVASDLMSDVLTLLHEEMLLITGLVNVQAIRTAMISEISHILFIRGKKVGKNMIDLAKDNDMILMECPLTMFKVCGLLYDAGLKSVY